MSEDLFGGDEGNLLDDPLQLVRGGNQPRMDAIGQLVDLRNFVPLVLRFIENPLGSLYQIDHGGFLQNLHPGVLTEIHDPIDGDLSLHYIRRAVIILQELVLLEEGEGRTVLSDGLAAQEAAAGLDNEVGGVRCVLLHYVGLHLNVRVLSYVIQTS